ncbi:hypothetical protein LINGRAHAP2_LOCUS4291 [Linum grandiflorum]
MAVWPTEQALLFGRKLKQSNRKHPSLF